MSTEVFIHQVLRVQFGLWAGFHYIFVPLSLGLLLCVNILRTCNIHTGRSAYEESAQLFTRFFVLTWLVGVATGYPLRWQLTQFWHAYTEHAKPVLDAIFEIEGMIGPVMLGGVLLLALGRRLLGARLHTVAGWILWVAMLAQAVTILSVNAWMQHPVGARREGHQWVLESLQAVLMSPMALHKVAHTLSAAMVTGAMFVLWVACSYQRSGRHPKLACASIRVATWVSVVATGCVLLSGHESAAEIAQTQPMKFAAMEAHWQTDDGLAPLVLFALPDEAKGINRFEVSVPALLSLLTTGTGPAPLGVRDLVARNEVLAHRAVERPGLEATRGWLSLREGVAEREGATWLSLTQAQQDHLVARASVPPVPGVFAAFHVMVFSGVLLAALSALVFAQRKALSTGRKPRLARLVQWALPLPWMATLGGWAVAELGRQPWTIYEHMPTWSAHVLPTVADSFGTAFVMSAAVLLIATGFVWAASLIYRGGRSPRPAALAC